MRAVTRFVLAAAVAASAVLLVPASVGAASASAASPSSGVLPKHDVVPIPGQPATYKRYAPSSYTPRGGPKFNDPYGSKSSRRALLTHVIKTINSVQGYPPPAGHQPPARQHGPPPPQPRGPPQPDTNPPVPH